MSKARKRLGLVSAVVLIVGVVCVRIVGPRLWGWVPAVPLWVVLIAAALTGLYYWKFIEHAGRSKKLATEGSFRARWTTCFVVCVQVVVFYILMLLAMDVSYFARNLWLYTTFGIATMGMAVVWAGWTRRSGERFRCANCGYERPERYSEVCDVCSECGHGWWLEGGAVRMKREPMWAAIGVGAAVIAGCVVLMFAAGVRLHDSLVRLTVSMVSSDRLIRAATDDYPGMDDEGFFRVVVSRDLSDGQRERLAIGLLDQAVAHRAMDGSLRWFEDELAAGRLSEEVRTRYLEQVVGKVGGRILNSVPVERLGRETLMIVATTGRTDRDSDICLGELLGRGLTEAEQERLAVGLLDRRYEQKSLFNTASRWLEGEILGGRVSDAVRERFFDEMVSVELGGEDRAVVGEPYEVVLASRRRHLSVRSAYDDRTYFGGVSVDGGATWRGLDVRRSRSGRNELGPYWGDPIQDVVFEEAGVQELTVRLWLVVVPDGDYTFGVEWLEEGEPRFSEETVWWTEVVLRKRVEVRERGDE